MFNGWPVLSQWKENMEQTSSVEENIFIEENITQQCFSFYMLSFNKYEKTDKILFAYYFLINLMILT